MYKNVIKLKKNLSEEDREYIIQKFKDIHSIKTVVPLTMSDDYTMEFIANSNENDKHTALLGAILVGSTEMNFSYLESWIYEDEDPEESGNVIQSAREVEQINNIRF